MRGAAKSLAILQGQLRYWLKAYPNTTPAIEALLKCPHSFEDIGQKLAKSTLHKMAEFHPYKGCIFKTKLKLRNRLDGGS